MSKWQPKTRGGYPVENVRPYGDPVYVWQGEVIHNGTRGYFTWTEDGYHLGPKWPGNADLIPLEAPAEAPAEPDARKALAMAAKAYKRAQDAVDAAVLASQVASTAFDEAFKALGKPDLAFAFHVDGKTFVFGEDGEFSRVEVL